MRFRLTAWILIGLALGAPSPAFAENTPSGKSPGAFATCMGKAPPEERVAACSKLLESKRIKDRTRAAYLNKRGRANYDARRLKEAIQDFSEAIRLQPADPEGYYNRGDALDENKEFDRAIADFDEAIRLDPRHAPTYNVRGLAYAHKRLYDRAIQDYDQALRLRPEYPDAYNNRGIAYFLKQDLDRAAADFERSLDQRLENPRAFFNLGTVNYMRGNFAESVRNVTAGASFEGLDARRAILLYAARARAGMDTREVQEYAARNSKRDRWPSLAFKLFAGEITPDALKAASVRGDIGPETWTCELNFVLGLHALLKGDRGVAREHFRRATASGADEGLMMLGLARAELRRLGAG